MAKALPHAELLPLGNLDGALLQQGAEGRHLLVLGCLGGGHPLRNPGLHRRLPPASLLMACGLPARTGKRNRGGGPAAALRTLGTSPIGSNGCLDSILQATRCLGRGRGSPGLCRSKRVVAAAAHDVPAATRVFGGVSACLGQLSARPLVLQGLVPAQARHGGHLGAGA